MGQDDVINLLKKYPDGLSVKELKTILGTTQSSVNNCLNRMKKFDEVEDVKQKRELKNGSGRGRHEREISIWRAK